MFDPYHKWLGIPKDQRPPTHYQLLGISPTEQDREVIEEFYLAALCRPLSEKELHAIARYVDKAKDRRTALEDVVWGLVNAKEYLLRR